jgi:hypothetical protein
MMNFNTLHAASKLKDAGFTQEQAEAAIDAISDSQVDISTKTDLYQLGKDISWQFKGLYAAIATMTAVMGWLVLKIMTLSESVAILASKL